MDLFCIQTPKLSKRCSRLLAVECFGESTWPPRVIFLEQGSLLDSARELPVKHGSNYSNKGCLLSVLNAPRRKWKGQQTAEKATRWQSFWTFKVMKPIENCKGISIHNVENSYNRSTNCRIFCLAFYAPDVAIYWPKDCGFFVQTCSWVVFKIKKKS